LTESVPLLNADRDGLSGAWGFYIYKKRSAIQMCKSTGMKRKTGGKIFSPMEIRLLVYLKNN
jgi:hypothetical protein